MQFYGHVNLYEMHIFKVVFVTFTIADKKLEIIVTKYIKD